jgi:glycogen operon protein
MQQQDWQKGDNHVLGMLISGHATDEVDDRGRPIHGDTLLLILNGGDADCRFTLPHVEEEGFWMMLLDSAHEERHGPPDGGASVTVSAHGLVLLRHGTERRMGPAAPEPEPAAVAAPASEGGTT